MKPVNRRHFLRLTGTTLLGMTLGGITLRVNAQEQLQADDPTAKALKYTSQSKIDGSRCGNCMYIQGEDGKEHRPCAIFPGKLVDEDGWCSAWVKRPG
ncbi:high-potential iron sulfur protein 2 [Alteromonas pelagimontana]|uniref:High-potential iron-sulfur protein n=1 Tax=Alteromonas pelagimontana TaxID=1858656 RepID=A0A6M4MCD0_9ALTE|nr:high-potential iron-sulfur protein [Alteromonas pelagimontana]QJR80782.1 high-potential iron sulfur protein 2 [Alteromonas pelagimontana]